MERSARRAFCRAGSALALSAAAAVAKLKPRREASFGLRELPGSVRHPVQQSRREAMRRLASSACATEVLFISKQHGAQQQQQHSPSRAVCGCAQHAAMGCACREEERSAAGTAAAGSGSSEYKHCEKQCVCIISTGDTCSQMVKAQG